MKLNFCNIRVLTITLRSKILSDVVEDQQSSTPKQWPDTSGAMSTPSRIPISIRFKAIVSFTGVSPRQTFRASRDPARPRRSPPMRSLRRRVIDDGAAAIRLRGLRRRVVLLSRASTCGVSGSGRPRYRRRRRSCRAFLLCLPGPGLRPGFRRICRHCADRCVDARINGYSMSAAAA